MRLVSLPYYCPFFNVFLFSFSFSYSNKPYHLVIHSSLWDFFFKKHIETLLPYLFVKCIFTHLTNGTLGFG